MFARTLLLGVPPEVSGHRKRLGELAFEVTHTYSNPPAPLFEKGGMVSARLESNTFG